MKLKSFIGFSLILLLLEVLIFREFIFGDFYFIFKDLGSDSYVNDYPLLYHRMLTAKEGFLPGWSFHNGLGENLYPYSFEPVSWILFKISHFSAESVMLAVPLVYIYLSGLLIYLFLAEHRLHHYANIFGGLVWAFSAYSLLASSWSVSLFSPSAFHFAFLLFALERAVSKKQYVWLAFVFLLIGISYPANLFFALVFWVCYFLASFYRKGNNQKEILEKLLYSIIYIFLGIGSSCWLLLSSMQLMLQSPRATGIVAVFESPPKLLVTKGELLSTVYRSFSPNILGDAAHFSAYGNYFEAPLLCSGILTLLLLSQFFLLGKKSRMVALSAIFVMVLIYISPYLRSFVWLRSGNYYRILNLFFSLILIVISSFILSKIILKGKMLARPLIIVASLFIILLIFGFFKIKIESGSSFLIPVIFIAIFSLLLIFRNKLPFTNVAILFLLIIATEPIMTSSQTIGQRGICDTNDIRVKGYGDLSSKVISKINKEDPSFFRLEKDFYSGVSWLASYNEAKIQNYNSSSAYNSFNNSNYISFLQTFGLVKTQNEPETRFVEGIRNSPVLMKLCSVKYFLSSKSPNEEMFKLGFEETEDYGQFKILKDDHVLPFGFCYDQIMGMKDFNFYSRKEKEQLSLQTLVGEESDLPDFKSSDFIFQPISHKTIDENTIDRKRETLQIDHFEDHHISGKISLNERRFLFLSMPFDKGWKAFDNGTSVKLYKAFGGLSFLIVEKGDHQIKLDYSPPYKDLGIWISVISILSLIIVILYQFKKAKNNG